MPKRVPATTSFHPRCGRSGRNATRGSAEGNEAHRYQHDDALGDVVDDRIGQALEKVSGPAFANSTQAARGEA